MNDLRHAFRRLRATPVVTLSAVACLAIGVWMTCIVTAVGRGVLRPDLHVSEADGLVQLDVRGLFDANACCGRIASVSMVDSLAVSPLFEAVGEYGGAYFDLSVDDALRAHAVLSSGMMRVLRVHPLLGRGFIPADDTTQNVVMLSYQAWLSLYGGDSAVIGRRLFFRRNRQAFTVIGVTRPDFIFPMDGQRPDFYTPILLRRGFPRYPATRMLGRLGEDVSLGEARQAVKAVIVRNTQSDREAMRTYWRALRPDRATPTLASGPVDVHLERYRTEPIDSETLRLIMLILACGFSVVAIAAANVTNLLLVRGASRRQEIAVRMALGAARLRILGELLLETGIVALAGVVVGFLAAAWQWSLIDPGFNGRHLFGEIDGTIATTAIVTGLALTMMIGTWPGLRATSMRLEQVLRDARRSGIGSSPLDGVLGRMVAGSTAATIALLILATLLTLSARASAARLAPPAQNVVTADVMFQDEAATERISVGRQALARIRALPGVTAAALGTMPGSAPTQEIYAAVAGMPLTRYPAVEVNAISDGYFATTGMRLLYGREFSPRETRDSSGAVILSRALAELLFPGRTGVGERFRFRRGSDSTFVDATVIGLAEAVRGGPNVRQMYVSISSDVPGRTTAVARYAQKAKPDIARALRGFERLTVFAAASIEQRAAERSAGRRYLSIGFTLFAVVALILAAVGTYGVVSYSVVRRTHEIGVRMALGAHSGRVTWMIVEQGLKTSVAGVIAGLLLAFAAARVVGGFVQDVSMDYPIAIGGVIVFVTVVSLVASGIPGLRAGRLNPVDALRSE